MDWLEEELGGYDDDYLIIDCPGMTTTYVHAHTFIAFRSNRIVHTSSIPSQPSAELAANGHTDMCCVPFRIPVHGRSIQVLQVCINSSLHSNPLTILQWRFNGHVRDG